MQEATTLTFAEAVRTLGQAARMQGLDVPTFRSPPGVAGAARTIRRRRGSAVISVALRGQPLTQVLADMIEGVVVANGLSGARATMARNALWLAVEDDASRAA